MTDKTDYPPKDSVIETLAKTIAWSDRIPNDVSENAEDLWDNIHPDGQAYYRKNAVAAYDFMCGWFKPKPSADEKTLSDLKINDWINAEIGKGLWHYQEKYGALSLGQIQALDDLFGEIARGAALQVIMDKATFLDNVVTHIHAINANAGWWTDLDTGEDLHGKRNVGELLALVHSEISEALEAHRKGLMDDKLPHRPGFRVELVDAIIRIFDILGSDKEGQREHPAGTIFLEKVRYNMKRADHKPENRRRAGGKKI